MDQIVINWIAAGVIGSIGWFARMLWDRVREQEKRINELEVQIARDYVSNGDLAHAITDMKAVVQALVHPIQSSIEYIRNRVDGMPQRRQGDPNV